MSGPHYEKSLTPEENKISRQNWNKAREELNVEPGQIMHHVLPCLREYNIKRYIEWDARDLVVMSRADHIKLHNDLTSQVDELSNRRNEKISKAHTGKYVGWRSGKARKVICQETGIVYGALSDAARAVDGVWQAIQKSCKDESKTAYGYHWRYYDSQM